MKRAIAEFRRDQIEKLAFHGKREDGREPLDFREVEIERDIIGTAEGSARVKLGNTDIIVGVKISPGQPYPDHPNEGVLKTGCEMKPMAHPEFEGGAPKPEVVEYARVIDRGIRESGMIDFGALCEQPGEKVWTINLDIQAVDYDGNIIDAGTIAGVAALQGAVVPASAHGLGEDFPLPVKGTPVSATFVRMGEHLLLDPTDIEESVADARLTVTTDDAGNIRAMQKALKGAFLYEQVSSAIDVSVQTGKAIREILNRK